MPPRGGDDDVDVLAPHRVGACVAEGRNEVPHGGSCTMPEAIGAPAPALALFTVPPRGAVLALDFGGRTGWAVAQGDARASGTWDLAPRRGESQGMRYVRLRAHLVRVREAYPGLALVVYEQAHHRGGAATEYAAGCVATLQAWCVEAGVEYAPVHTATLKVHATGQGNASKPAMVAAARRRGWAPGDDNEADALWLLDYAERELAAGTPLGGGAPPSGARPSGTGGPG